MGKFEDALSEGYAQTSQEVLPMKACPTCAYYLNGSNAQLCKALAFPQPEPLFYAILKCGSDRKWHTPRTQNGLPVSPKP